MGCTGHGVGRVGCVARGGGVVGCTGCGGRGVLLGVVAGCDGLGCNLSSDELGIAIHCTQHRLIQ